MVTSNNFMKTITVVPDMMDFVGMVLSKTPCRKTPKEGCAISRVGDFYMHKVQYTEQNFTKKLSIIIEEFPQHDDIDHSNPIYDDIDHAYINKDHYKLALAQLNSARKDYVKLLKYAYTLYQCKCLKAAALGRMVTAIKRIGPSFAYLELIRQHMARLSSVDHDDPNTQPTRDCLNRLHVAIPKPRDERKRPPCIPRAVLEAKAKEDADYKEKMKQLVRDVEKENSDASADGYFASLKKRYSVLENDDWEDEDIMPEILDGHNVFDFIDPDILQRLQRLEQEEDSY